MSVRPEWLKNHAELRNYRADIDDFLRCNVKVFVLVPFETYTYRSGTSIDTYLFTMELSQERFD